MNNTIKRHRKPKKADFIFDNKRYWISGVSGMLLWDKEYISISWYDALHYEDDSEPTSAEQTDDFFEACEKAGRRVMRGMKAYLFYDELY